MGDRLRAGKPQYFTKPPRPTQPLTFAEREMSTSQSAATLCGWGYRQVWFNFIPLVDKRVDKTA